MYKALHKITFFLVLFLVAGCSPAAMVSSRSPGPTPTATLLHDGRVTIRLANFPALQGRLYGHGKVAVLLASRGGQPESEWAGFAGVLADEGFTALTVGSALDEGMAEAQVGSALAFLRQNGFDRLICVGAGSGASGCAANASQSGLLGLALLSYPGGADLSKSSLPKLFIVGELDQSALPATQAGYQAAGQPKALVVVPGTNASGAALLTVASSGDLQATLVDFIEQCAGQ